MAVSHHDATHNRAKIKHHVYGRNCSRWLSRRVAGSGFDPPAVIGVLGERCRRFSGSGLGRWGVSLSAVVGKGFPDGAGALSCISCLDCVVRRAIRFNPRSRACESRLSHQGS